LAVEGIVAAEPQAPGGFELHGPVFEIHSPVRGVLPFPLNKPEVKDYTDLRLFETYFETFKLGMPPHGGFAVGLERFIMQLLGLENARLAMLFPRDLTRLTL
jgi:aspartyl/asparaginyl-tRNA synthetase